MMMFPIRRILAIRRCLGVVCILGWLGASASRPAWAGPGVSPAPEVPWTPPPNLKKPAIEKTKLDIPSGLLERSESLTLVDLVDVALRNNTATRAAWAAARAAAAGYQAEKGSYYPQVGTNAGLSKQHGGSSSGSRPGSTNPSFTSGVDVSFLVFDFGGRGAAVEEMRQALIAADFTHNAVLQYVMLAVEQAYYDYATSKALLTVEQSAVNVARTSLEVAEQRHRIGVATIADVLQARTALARAKLAEVTLEGRINSTRGSLATAVGVPADTPFDVVLPPEDLPLDRALDTVKAYLAKADERRPDLGAARARYLEAQAHVKTIKARGYPSITATGFGSHIEDLTSSSDSNNYSAGVQVRFPLFTGFSQTYDVRKAEALLDQQGALLEMAGQAADLQVWDAYYDLITARESVRAAETLVSSATESLDVAQGRYKEGVGTILDLLSAQRAATEARALMVVESARWLMSLTRLSYATGTLYLPGQDPVAAPAMVPPESDHPEVIP